MCGIAGYFGSKFIGQDVLERTLFKMSKRGPDHQEAKSFVLNEMQVYLLHSRLSIVDLDRRSDQPYIIGDHVIIFNGEIYNFIELRDQLVATGMQFHTTSDTEVLLQYYIKYGENCVSYFEGMWAFAIYNIKTGQVFLSRDRFGEKPLYYYQTQHGIYFGSEIKFIREISGFSLNINKRHLQRYLGLGYKALYKFHETFYEGVFELRAGENCSILYGEEPKFYKYWVPHTKVNEDMTLPEAIAGTRDLLIDSMKIRLRADVPLAFCLSGGIDSASLVSIAAKIFNYNVETFSIIDSDERYNEKDNIAATIKDTGCKSHYISLSHDNNLQRLIDLINYHDAPVATISFFVHSMLSEQISKSGFKVAFSGTSADELFTGYYDHFLLHLYEMRNNSDYQTYLNEWLQHIGSFVRNPILKNPELYQENPMFREHVLDNSKEFCTFLVDEFDQPFFETSFTENLLRNRMLNELFHEATPVILHEDDLNSMLYSIENRSPFLDTALFQFAYSIPAKHLIRDGYGKYVLRESMKGILNDEVRLDRRKKGFNASINSLFDLRNKEIRNYFLDPHAEIFKIVKHREISKLFDLNPAPNEYSKFIFNFMNARIFLDTNFN
jgi:asparagine synthase (glutamine-hydrolysing)